MGKKDTTAGVVLGLVVGIAAGYVAGILTAPKSGKETRQDIKDASGRAIQAAQDQPHALQAQVSELAEQAAARAKSLSSRGKQELDELVESAKVAQGKAKAMLTAAKDGEATDPELDQAIEKANEAKEHLSNYLKNS
jgi:gas vesicle protein